MSGAALLVMWELLIAVVSLVAEQGLEGKWASVDAARELSSCGFRAWFP